MDDSTFREAKKIADEAYPLPERDPVMAGIYGAIVAFMVVILYLFLEEWMRDTLAWLVTAALCGVVAYLDCSQKFRLHSAALRAAVDRIRSQTNV